MKKTKKQNPYRFCRNQRDLTRDEVYEAIGMSIDRLGDIEKERDDRRLAEPEDIVSLSRLYEIPRLCNFYCSKECEVGKEIGFKAVEIDGKEDLAQITLEILYCLEELRKVDEKRLVAISRDGEITEDEREDFEKLKKSLEAIANAYASLKLWEKEDQALKLWEQKEQKIRH